MAPDLTTANVLLGIMAVVSLLEGLSVVGVVRHANTEAPSAFVRAQHFERSADGVRGSGIRAYLRAHKDD